MINFIKGSFTKTGLRSLIQHAGIGGVCGFITMTNVSVLVYKPLYNINSKQMKTVITGGTFAGVSLGGIIGNPVVGTLILSGISLGILIKEG